MMCSVEQWLVSRVQLLLVVAVFVFLFLAMPSGGKTQHLPPD